MELSIETMPIAFINNKQPNFGSSYKDILSIRVLVLLSISFLEGGDGIWETSQENSIDTKRKQVDNESMQETVKDTQCGFLSSERETGDLDLDYGSKRNSSSTLLYTTKYKADLLHYQPEKIK